MPIYSTDRRGALKILGAIGASCACPIAGDELFGRSADEAAAPAHHHAAGQQAALPAKPIFFPAADFETVSRIADLIIPQTGTPGAVAAGVPAYIDLIVSRNASQQSLVSDGLRWLDEDARRMANRRFVALSEQQQLSILQPLCDAADAGKTEGRLTQFFVLIKALTADGYYTSQIGLIEELGYKGNTVLASYPECVHEH
jgi:gluconate 2-dehydrogenase gamma chain